MESAGNPGPSATFARTSLFIGDNQRLSQFSKEQQQRLKGLAWIGRAAFTDQPHMFQNIGDGTFFHAGSLAMAAGIDITYKILYNSAVAMTGGWDVAGGLGVDVVISHPCDNDPHISLTTRKPASYLSRLRGNVRRGGSVLGLG